MPTTSLLTAKVPAALDMAAGRCSLTFVSGMMNWAGLRGVVSVEQRETKREGESGDQEDHVQEVYDASYRRLVVQLFALTGDLADAEDAVQEAFVKALSLGRAFADLDNREAWLRTVALNHVATGGVTRRWPADCEPRCQAQPRRSRSDPEHVALVEALARLDLAHRTAVVLFYLADRSVGDIAIELGVPVGTVKTRWARGRELLAPLLSEAEEADHA